MDGQGLARVLPNAVFAAVTQEAVQCAPEAELVALFQTLQLACEYGMVVQTSQAPEGPRGGLGLARASASTPALLRRKFASTPAGGTSHNRVYIVRMYQACVPKNSFVTAAATGTVD